MPKLSNGLTRRTLLRGSTAAALGTVFTPAIIGQAMAAPMKIRISTGQANDPKYGQGRVFFDNLTHQLAADGLGDAFQLQFFPDNQLGQEIDVINSIKLGVIECHVSGSSIAANLVPIVGTFDLGYLFDSFPQQGKAFDTGAIKPVEEALLKSANIRILGWGYNFGSRSILSRKAVNTPEDLTGVKIRTLPNPIITECIKLMGAAATPLAFGETYTALQAGVLDGLEHDAPTVLASKFYETAKFYSLTQHIFQPLAIFYSELAFQRIDTSKRDRFAEAARKAVMSTRAHALTVEQEAIDVLKEKGVSIIACDREAFKKRVLPQTDAFMKRYPESKSIIETIRSTTT